MTTVDELTRQLESATEELRQWQEAARSLSQSAALARAENQGAGRGVGAMFLGPRYRSAVRRTAAASNAAIAKDVAKKRVVIAEGKARVQAQIRELKAALAAAKRDEKERSAASRVGRRAGAAGVPILSNQLTLLAKLKEAHDLGLLTDAEFELKKRQLLQLP